MILQIKIMKHNGINCSANEMLVVCRLGIWLKSVQIPLFDGTGFSDTQYISKFMYNGLSLPEKLNDWAKKHEIVFKKFTFEKI